MKSLKQILKVAELELSREQIDISMIELDKHCDGLVSFEDLRKWLFGGARNAPGMKG